MTPMTPCDESSIADHLFAAIDRTPGIDRVKWTRGVPLPHTQRPEYPIATDIGSHVRTIDRPRRHVSVFTVIHGHDALYLAVRIEAMLLDFRKGVRGAILDQFGAPPLPHVEHGVQAYTPVLIDGGYARVILSYSAIHQGYAVTIDALPRLMPD